VGRAVRDRSSAFSECTMPRSPFRLQTIRRTHPNQPAPEFTSQDHVRRTQPFTSAQGAVPHCAGAAYTPACSAPLVWPECAVIGNWCLRQCAVRFAVQHAGLDCDDEVINRDAEAFCKASDDCVFIDPWSDEPRLARCAPRPRRPLEQQGR
jgi:hypothetical protein